MKVLELFAGTRSIGRAFEAKGHEVYSIEWDKIHKDINWYVDISTITAKDILERFGQPDVIWCSFDCTSYSIAGISHHRRKDENGNLAPISEYAKFCDTTNTHAIDLIRELNPKYYFVENPRGGLRKMNFMQDLPRYTVTYYLAPETRLITKQGVYEIKDLVNQEVDILAGNGEWIKSPFKSYGKQKLMKITLSRAKRKKEIYATPNHLWIISGREIETKDLKYGQRLDYAKTKINDFKINQEFVARGFAFGDGWVLKNQSKKKGFVMFVEDKQEMIPYFKNYCGKIWNDNNKAGLSIKKMYGYPRSWKTEYPPLSENSSNLFSWLAGYIASDGTVHKNSGQVSISSSNKEDLEYVRSLCNIIGLDTYSIVEYMRIGYGDVETPLYQMTIMKKFIPKELILREKHLNNFIKSGIPKHQALKWSVIKVEESDRIEDVYCADMPEVHTFVLEDGIVTHNCQYGDIRMKPTDIWTNHPNPRFKPPCKNGDPCHVAAPRGSATGTQGIKGSIDRSRIPEQLCKHIVEICEDGEEFIE